MKHARPDYSRIQDPALHDPSLLGENCTPIGEDEPVILFRAQDKLFHDVLLDYYWRIQTSPEVSPEQRAAIQGQLRRHTDLAKEWQAKHGCKAPDVPLPSLERANAVTPPPTATTPFSLREELNDASE